MKQLKKIMTLLLVFIIIFTVGGCSNKKKDNTKALEFKKEYESLNGKTNSSGKEHRTVTIAEDNPYIKVKPSDIIEKIKNKETFYLYVGDPLCPWCRSVIEKSIEVAKDSNIDEIYYIDIWDEDGNEILRDKYELVDGKLTQTIEGTAEYKELLKAFEPVLRDYVINDAKGKEISVGEKRIYAPNYFQIKNGEVIKMVSGKSNNQTDPREELTKEILEDEEEQFIDLFLEICDDAC